jgi:hypothetical protein
MQQTEVTQNHENANVRNIGKGEPRQRKRGLNSAAMKHMNFQVTRLQLYRELY